MPNRPVRILLVVAAVALLAGAGIAVNFVLLRYADSRNDPVGKLTPRATVVQPTQPPAATTPEGRDDESDESERDD